MDKWKSTHTGKWVTHRRGFFKQCLVDMICLVEEFKGRPQMRLSDLDQAPEEVIRTMVPVFNPRRPCITKGNRILLEKDKSGEYEQICEMDRMNADIFHYFGGSMTIDEISREIERRYDLDSHTAYERVRAWFLFLAKRMVCFPAHAHDENGPCD